MAHKPVGSNQILDVTGTSARSSAIAQQSDSMRVVAIGTDPATGHTAPVVHVKVESGDPTATSANYVISAGQAEVISIGKPLSQRVVGVSTTGTSTIIDFPEGTGSPFSVGDHVSLTAFDSQTYLQFSHKEVTAVDNSAGFNGLHGTRITVDHDYGVGYAHTQPKRYAELRSSIKIAAITSSGSNPAKLHFQQVQTSGGAN